ncbi:hypothetical protein BXO88_05115 [Oribacterium sp. C9]|uniref:hypothetical protein n=1 Tax=Oribacterium sp. C9 TaxID=1943579 RepID=UPI00098EC304|nr:hypothetical protein [Oribacterium sp. C9]OON87247.1 hypothetical protein BXO88_05115 [Oribacterium sp. C9]
MKSLIITMKRKKTIMSEYEKTQWHPPFCAAMKLELKANKNDLSFDSERTLNTKPIQMDLLVIKKKKEAKIENEIGRLFLQHNIFEYKSPEDELGIDEYFKTMAYACLYKANAEKEDVIKSTEMTISLVREGMTRTLINWLKINGSDVFEKSPGIFYISGDKILFPTQIIISSRLNATEHRWLKALTRKMDENAAKCLVTSAKALIEKDDKENADSILNLAMIENEEIFNKLKGVPEMNEALIKLMKPELDAAKASAKNEGKAEAAAELATVIRLLKSGSLVQTLLDKGYDSNIVKSASEILAEIS